MKTQPRSNVSRVLRLLASVVLILILAVFVAGNAQACHKGVPHGKDAPDFCAPPGPEAPDNDVIWGFDENSGVIEINLRHCVMSQMTPDSVGGAYDCEMNSDHITYNFQDMPCRPIHRKGDDWRCAEKGDWMHIEPDDEYSFHWEGDCTTDSGCDVIIVNRFSNDGYIGNSVDRITMEAFVSGVTTSAGNPTGNPFYEAQDLTVEYIHITKFGTKGRKKVLAVCELTPAPGHPVTFHTVPTFE